MRDERHGRCEPSMAGHHRGWLRARRDSPLCCMLIEVMRDCGAQPVGRGSACRHGRRDGAWWKTCASRNPLHRPPVSGVGSSVRRSGCIGGTSGSCWGAIFFSSSTGVARPGNLGMWCSRSSITTTHTTVSSSRSASEPRRTGIAICELIRTHASSRDESGSRSLRNFSSRTRVRTFFAHYARRHRKLAVKLSATMGFEVDGSDSDFREAGNRIRFVRLRRT